MSPRGKVRWAAAAPALVVLISLGAGCVKKERAAGQRRLGIHEVFRSARDRVFALGGEGAGVQGTAFLVTHGRARHLVASFHVASKLPAPWVQDRAGKKWAGLRVTAVDREHDLALLDAGPLPADMAGLDVTTQFETSQQVFLVGFPGMGTRQVRLNFSPGVISDDRYEAPTFIGEGKIQYIQVSAAINLGHSGSPLLDRLGRVIGVAAWRLDPGAQISGGNYAVPARHVATLIAQLGERGGEPAGEGRARACRKDGDCVWLDYCIEGRCQALRRAAQACSVGDDCVLPLRCHDNACTAPAASGAACCCDQLCTQPDHCVMGKCRPLSRRGGACAVDQDCLAPLFCVGGRCVREKSAAGGPCHHHLHCKTPLGCLEGRCRSTAGRACAAAAECAPLACILGRCRNLAAEAEGCATSRDCLAPLICVSGACQPVRDRPAGEDRGRPTR